jgi:hypothetical protein
MAGSMKENG